MQEDFDCYSAARQIAEYEKRRPKKYRNSGWEYCGAGYYRGAQYGRILPETGYLYTTQAWAVLQKCWKGYKIAKGHDDVKLMKYYAEGISKAKKELGLKVDSFPNLGLYGTIEDDSSDSAKIKKAPNAYENPPQRRSTRHLQ
jgi:hypothetical protein